MVNFVSEIFSIIMGILTKTAFIAFPILFMSSLLLKMNWVHYSGFSMTMFLLIINITMAYGWVYIIFYIIARGISGHYVPKGLPPFPYFMTTPQVQHINYLKEDQNSGIKELPRIGEDYTAYADDNYQGNFLSKILSWIFPKLKWKDQFLKNVVDPEKIFEIKNSKDCGSYLRYYDLSQPGAM